MPIVLRPHGPFGSTSLGLSTPTESPYPWLVASARLSTITVDAGWTCTAALCGTIFDRRSFAWMVEFACGADAVPQRVSISKCTTSTIAPATNPGNTPTTPAKHYAVGVTELNMERSPRDSAGNTSDTKTSESRMERVTTVARQSVMCSWCNTKNGRRWKSEKFAATT